ncbi:MAG: hypothetical protein JOY51_07200 [Nevskia sp.]|nr:hypothetical protein [Nevskia sp.]
MNSVIAAVIYGIVSMVVVPMIFSIFKTKYTPLDVALASAGAALVSLIPTIGGPASFAVMIGVLYWRLREDLSDIFVAVMVARLASLPVLLVLKLKAWPL